MQQNKKVYINRIQSKFSDLVYVTSMGVLPDEEIALNLYHDLRFNGEYDNFLKFKKILEKMPSA